MSKEFLFLLTADEAIEAIAQRVVQLLNASKNDEKMTHDKSSENLISTDEACAILRITRATMDSWRKKGIVPYHRKGSRIYFYKSEILESLETPKIGKRRKYDH